MANRKRTVEVEVVADTKKATASLQSMEGKMAKTGKAFAQAGAVMAASFSIDKIGQFVGDSVRAFSELEQSVGGTEAIFGSARDTVDEFAAGSAQSMGLSEAAFRTATTSIGGQLKRMTGDVDFAAEHAVALTGVAADLAATYGGTTQEAVEALGAAFRGEADPAERFNLNLKVSAVNAEAVALGLADSTAAVDDNARAQALLSLVTKQSADAQGQFAREADTVAGKTQIATAQLENQKAVLGEQVANPWTAVQIGTMSTFGMFVTEITNEIKLLKGEMSEAEAAVSEWQIANATAATTTDHARQIAEDYGVSVAEVARVLGITETGTNRHRGSVEKLRAKYAETEDAVDAYADALLEAADPAFNLVKKQEGFVTAQQRYNAAVKEFGPQSAQARGAAADLLESVGGLNAAQERYNNEYGPEGEQALRDLARQAGIYGDDLADILDFLNRIGAATVALPPVAPSGGGSRGGWTGPYHEGGIVQGTPGSDQLIMAQAGETVIRRADTRTGGGVSTINHITVTNPSSVFLAELMELRRRGVR